MSQVILRELKLNSAVKYVAREGFVNNFPITFAYDNPAQLQVFVGFKRVPSWELKMENGLPSVVLPEDLKIGQSITIRRATPADGVPHTYQYKGNAQGGAEFSAKTIDENFEYMSNLVSEVEDYNTIAQDNLSDMEEKFDVTQDIANEAIRVAGEAQGTADNAEQVALGIDGKAQEALDNSVEALGVANDAKTTALGIDGKAQEALDQSTTASQDASNALSIAQGIDGKAQSALDNSSEALGTANTALTVAQGIDGKAQEALDSIPTDYVKDSDFNALSTIVNNKRDLDDNVFNGLMTIKSDNDEQGAGISLQDTDGEIRGQVVATDQGLQLTQYPKGGGLQTFTFPNDGGELLVKSDIPSLVLKSRQDLKGFMGGIIYVTEFLQDSGIGGGTYYYNADMDRADANGGTIIDPYVVFSGDVQKYLNDQGTGAGKGCYVIIGDVRRHDITLYGAVPGNNNNEVFKHCCQLCVNVDNSTLYIPEGEFDVGHFGGYQMDNNNFKFICDGTLKHAWGGFGWYPKTLDLKPERYKNIYFGGKGTLIPLSSQFQNDLWNCEGVILEDLTFIEPIYSGHFLDIANSEDVLIDNIRVYGSRNEDRDFAEFIQIANDIEGGPGLGRGREPEVTQYFTGVRGVRNVTLRHSKFENYMREDGTLSRPPVAIGNHGGINDTKPIYLHIHNNILNDSYMGATISLPSLNNVIIENNIIEKSVRGPAIITRGSAIDIDEYEELSDCIIRYNKYTCKIPDWGTFMDISNGTCNNLVIAQNTLNNASGGTFMGALLAIPSYRGTNINNITIKNNTNYNVLRIVEMVNEPVKVNLINIENNNIFMDGKSSSNGLESINLKQLIPPQLLTIKRNNVQFTTDSGVGSYKLILFNADTPPSEDVGIFNNIVLSANTSHVVLNEAVGTYWGNFPELEE